MRIHRRVFVFALSAGMVVGAIRGYKMFLAILLIEWYGLSPSQCRLWLNILSVVMSIIPLILFVALYRLGRRIDMRSTYVDVSASLFIGCALAHFFGYVMGFFINPVGRETWTSVWTSILEMAAMQGFSYGLYLFFLGFTAIALAYLRSEKQMRARMIRKASLEDTKGILRVINEANKQAYREIIPPKHFREPVITEGELLEILRENIFYIHERGEEIRGVAALLPREDSGVMDWVYVLPEYQRMGIGTALVNRLEDEAKERGLEKLMLQTAEKARWAVEFYLKLGYRITDRISTSWGYDVVMEKNIESTPNL